MWGFSSTKIDLKETCGCGYLHLEVFGNKSIFNFLEEVGFPEKQHDWSAGICYNSTPEMTQDLPTCTTREQVADGFRCLVLKRNHCLVSILHESMENKRQSVFSRISRAPRRTIQGVCCTAQPLVKSTHDKELPCFSCIPFLNGSFHCG